MRPDATVNLLDYGAIRVFGFAFLQGVIDLVEAVRDDDDAKAHHAYTRWGFTDLSNEKMAAPESVCPLPVQTALCAEYLRVRRVRSR